jgi:hypothetical protein
VAAPPGDPSSYTFAFWAVPSNVQPTQFTNGVPDSQQVSSFTAPTDESFNATAWYVADGSGGPAALVWAFSLNKSAPIPTATLTSIPPFASVSPPECVEGPNMVSTTDPAAIAAGSVTITAAGLIEGSGRFQQWLQFFGNGVVTGQQLTMKAGAPSDAGSSDAIAVYSIPQPDPCQPIRTQIADLNQGDFPNPADYLRAFRALEADLRQCEQEYGEL